MSSEFGKNIKVSIWGESHSKAIGAVMSGLSAGEKIDMGHIGHFLERRAPGRNEFSTGRNEADSPILLSGIVNGMTTGTPIGFMIENKDTKSSDYKNLVNRPRPGHADYTAYAKYGDAHDVRGGGHFSGRLTAPLCAAGAMCIQILERRGIFIGAHIASIGSINDASFNNINLSAETLLAPSQKSFPVNDDARGEMMKDVILDAKSGGDSIGGTIECGIIGLPAGAGDPMFAGIENRISQAVFGIPAIKGIEFGAGFSGTEMKGSEFNDPLFVDHDGKIRTKSNNNGGIQGGISNGMPVCFKVAVRPTSSIAIEQQTVDLKTMENISITVNGRHDPCIVPRAVPCIEAATAIVILDMIYDERQKCE